MRSVVLPQRASRECIMRDPQEVELLRFYIETGNFDEAVPLMGAVLEKYKDGNIPKKLKRLLDKAAMEHPFAALTLGCFCLARAYRLPPGMTVKDLLERGVGSDNPFVKTHAFLSLGQYHLMQGEIDEALQKLEEARKRGSGDASLMLSDLYVSGDYWGKNLAKARAYLEEAVRRKLPAAQTRMAALILEGVLDSPHDPFELLELAMLAGDPEAKVVYEHFAVMDNEDEDDDIFGDEYEAELEEIVPNDMKRPKQVRDALIREFGMPSALAEKTTAAFHGFDSWKLLTIAVNDKRVPRGIADEDCTAAAFNARRKIQSTILNDSGIHDEYVSETAIRLLKPTAKKGKPSLRRLETEIENNLFPVSKRELEDGMADFFRGIGIEDDPMEFLRAARTIWPITPEPWFDILEGKFGWTFGEKYLDKEQNGDKIGTAIAGDGKVYDLFMSSIGYNPGDQEDEEAENLMQDIARSGVNAVLLFNKPLFFPVGQKGSRRGLLYGGKILNNGKWSDFALTAGGIDAALAQGDDFEEGKPSGELLENASYPDAKDYCALLGILGHGLDPDEPQDVAFLHYDSGWVGPITGSIYRFPNQD